MSNLLDKTAIPLCAPNLIGNEKEYVSAAIDSNWLSGGSYLNTFEKKLADFTGASYVIGTSSGTTALQIALLLAGVKPSDLVIIPNLTFVATANAVKYIGADPVLLDIDPHTWVLDINLLADFLAHETYMEERECYLKRSKRRIKAIVPVHLLGNLCNMVELLDLAQAHGLTVVEDAACSLGSFQGNQHSGTFGLLGTLSFNSNKIITTGGGGAILTNQESIAKQAKHLITQAKSSALDYFHDQLGYNYRLVNPLAAIGLAQLELLPEFIKAKVTIANYYREHLSINHTSYQVISPNTASNYWHVALLTERSRELVAELARHNIESRPLWIPINELPVFENDLYINRLNRTKEISAQGIMLPCSTSITTPELARVCSVINQHLAVNSQPFSKACDYE